MWRRIRVYVAARLKGLSLLLAGACFSASAWAEPLSFELLRVDYREGSYFAHLAFQVAARPAVVREVLTDFDHMAEFVPNLESSRLLEQNGNVYRIFQRGRARLGPFSIGFDSERRVEWFPDGRLVSDALSGKVQRLHSEMRLEARPSGTRLDYQVEMRSESWFPASFGERFMRHELAEQFSAMAAEMLKREGRAQH